MNTAQTPLYIWQQATWPHWQYDSAQLAVAQARQQQGIIIGKAQAIGLLQPADTMGMNDMNGLLGDIWLDEAMAAAIDGIVRAAIAHLWFETLHPFEDGNGRIGRAIVDMALAQDSGQTTRFYSLSRQLLENRGAYYDALNQAQKGNLEITPWLLWFVEQFKFACTKSAAHMDNALAKTRFRALYAPPLLNPRQSKTLQKLLDAGDGGFLGGLTSEKHSKISGASKATATRDLSDLLQKGLLFARGTGKATKYYVNVPGWQHDE